MKKATPKKASRLATFIVCDVVNNTYEVYENTTIEKIEEALGATRSNAIGRGPSYQVLTVPRRVYNLYPNRNIS